jgi:GT2 family glycosyltransferase
MRKEDGPPRRAARRGKGQKRPGPWQPAWVQSFLAPGPLDVSVCIANWNCQELLRTCLESLQDRPQGVRLETIVVDNGSEDGAAEMVARDFPEVVLIRNEANAGFARANNQAARVARGRYLLFLNNDTVVPPAALRRLVDYADAHPEAGMIGPRLRDPDGRVQVSCRPRPTLPALLHRTSLFRWTGLFRRAYQEYRRDLLQGDGPCRVDVLMGAAVLLPRDVFFDLGAWDEEFTFGGEDLDLSLRVGRQYAVIYLPRVEITHHGRASTRHHVSFASAHIPAGFVRYLRKSGCSRWALLVYQLALTLGGPVHVVEKVVQYLWRRPLRQREAAEQTWGSLRTAWHFVVKGIPALWRA